MGESMVNNKRTVLITGANTGLGYQCAKVLLEKGYEVILGCRSLEKAEVAKKSLIKKTKNNNVDILQIDLGSLEDIRKKVKEIKKPLWGLVCNAGISNGSIVKYTKDGFEETFGVNHLGHFLLTNLILKKYSTTLRRIAIVASELHNPEGGTKYFPAPKFNSFKDMAMPSKEQIESEKNFGGLCYVNSKLSNVIFTYALNDYLQSNGLGYIFVNAISPGFVPDTGLNRDQSATMKFVMKNIFPRMGRFIPGIATVEEGGTAIARLIDNVDVTGKYFDRLEEIPSSALSYEKHLRSELWEESAAMVQLK